MGGKGREQLTSLLNQELHKGTNVLERLEKTIGALAISMTVEESRLEFLRAMFFRFFVILLMAASVRLMIGGNLLFLTSLDLLACCFGAAFLMLTIKLNLLFLGETWASFDNQDFCTWLSQAIALGPLEKAKGKENDELWRLHYLEMESGVSQKAQKLRVLNDCQREALHRQKKRNRLANDLAPFFDLSFSAIVLVCILLVPVLEI